MAQIIRSGAFLQQCWSVHPLCVSVKRMADERTLVLACSSCKMAHHAVLGMVVPKESASAVPDGSSGQALGESLLSGCVETHQASLTLRQMDVFQDMMLLRCADCRRHYEVTVTAFETHQK
jgi:hypothetical protein